MRLSFVQSYPIYHDGFALEDWLAVRNRDRFMPAVAAALGHEVELLAVDRARRSLASAGPDVGGYRIEIFPADRGGRRTRCHASSALVEHARARGAAVHVIKGIDGGAGLALMRDLLLPGRRPFAVVIGGKYYGRLAARAGCLLCETQEQRQRLARPGARFWRRRVPLERTILLPKSVDTATFRPAGPAEGKRWDVILVGRLLRWKGFDAVAPLAGDLRIAVVGDGPELDRLSRRFPGVDWLGRRPHAEVAGLLRQARLLYNPGRFDYYPRVVAEAFACGVPVVACTGGVSPDSIPPGTGLLVPPGEAPGAVRSLLADPARLDDMARRARAHAERELGPTSSGAALIRALELLAPRP